MGGFALTLGTGQTGGLLFLAKVYEALKWYFMGLAKLSADSIANYTVDTVTTSLAGGRLAGYLEDLCGNDQHDQRGGR